MDCLCIVFLGSMCNYGYDSASALVRLEVLALHRLLFFHKVVLSQELNMSSLLR